MASVLRLWGGVKNDLVSVRRNGLGISLADVCFSGSVLRHDALFLPLLEAPPVCRLSQQTAGSGFIVGVVRLAQGIG